MSQPSAVLVFYTFCYVLALLYYVLVILGKLRLIANIVSWGGDFRFTREKFSPRLLRCDIPFGTIGAVQAHAVFFENHFTCFSSLLEFCELSMSIVKHRIKIVKFYIKCI